MGLIPEQAKRHYNVADAEMIGNGHLLVYLKRGLKVKHSSPPSHAFTVGTHHNLSIQACAVEPCNCPGCVDETCFRETIEHVIPPEAFGGYDDVI